jgi:cleavage and polyadenylation specificity factor subunit 1
MSATTTTVSLDFQSGIILQVACSGHGKNGSLSVLHQSIRPDLITEVELPGCTGIWTVYHKAQRDSASDIDLVTSKDEEFHAYLIISLGSRTMVRCPGYRCPRY